MNLIEFVGKCLLFSVFSKSIICEKTYTEVMRYLL